MFAPGFDLSSIFAKISALAPDFTPFPLLNELNLGGATAVAPAAASIAPGEWDWLDPTKGRQVPIPGDPSKVQTGPLAGVALPTPPAAGAGQIGAAPFSLQQAALLASMQNQGQQQPRTQAPSAGVVPGARSVNMQAFATPTSTRPPIGLAEILGLTRR